MPIHPSHWICVKSVVGKGRGVFATRPIPAETVIEVCPVIPVPTAEIPSGRLADYAFSWSRGTLAIVLGFGSLYNHSYQPNARSEDRGRMQKHIIAERDIDAGEEITMNYNGDPEDLSDVGFDVRD